MFPTCTRESIGRHPCRGNSPVFLQGRPASKWQQDELLPRRMKSNIEASCRDTQRNTEVTKIFGIILYRLRSIAPLVCLLFSHPNLKRTWYAATFGCLFLYQLFQSSSIRVGYFSKTKIELQEITTHDNFKSVFIFI